MTSRFASATSHRLGRRHQPHLLALADHHGLRETVDARERHMQIGEDAHFAALDHVLAEAREIARPGAAGVDRRGDAGAAAEVLRVDAERGAAPIHMGVQVDQAGRHDVALHVAHFRRVGQVVPHLGDLAAGERHVGDAVDVLRRVDDPPALQDEVECHGVSRNAALARAVLDQAVDELAAFLQLGDRDELVGLVRLVDIARPAHHRRNAGLREQAALGAVGDLAVAVAAGELLVSSVTSAFSAVSRPANSARS